MNFINYRYFRLSLAFVGVILTPMIGAADVAPPRNASASAFNPANYSGGNGLSKANAVVLKIADDVAGIGSEYAWVMHNYPGSRVVQQALTTWDHDKRYDVLTVETSDHSMVELWFDITLLYK
jgi:hypothetical protein